MSPSRQTRRALVRALGVVFACAVLPARAAVGQSRTFTACTPDALQVCAELQLDAVDGGLFALGLRTIGSITQPALPVSVYNLVFSTGVLPIAPVAVSTLVAPVGVGGAVVTDASEWEVFDTGDALFLSALSNRGVRGCVAGADVDGFGQAVTTCGAGQFARFTFAPSIPFNPRSFTILDLEAVALISPAQGASCGAPGAGCLVTADTGTSTTTPEPATIAIVGVGLLATGAVARRRSGL